MKQLIILFLATLFCLPSVLAQDCTEDCVWPGDLNANGVANYLDFLTFGFCYQSTGPARTNQSTMWEPLNADDWAGTLPVLGTNFKHSDADGNGVVDEMDRLVIAINYTQMNPNFVDFLGHSIDGDDLFAVLVDSVVAPGGSLVFDIHLGTAANPISDIYGIGFQINIDTQHVENVLFDYTENWLGVDDEVLVHNKYSDEHDFIGMALTRFDGVPVSGFGRIARVEIVITDVVLGLEVDSTACIPFPLTFENVLGIDENENDKLITTHSDTMGIKHPSQLTSVFENPKKLKNTFKVFPNPSDRYLTIKSSVPFSDLMLYNQMGEVVWRKTPPSVITETRLDCDLLNLPSGLYFIGVRVGSNWSMQKVLLE